MDIFLVALGIAYILQSKKLYRLEQDLRRALIQLKSESKQAARGTRQIFEKLETPAPTPVAPAEVALKSASVEAPAQAVQPSFQAHFERNADSVGVIEKEPLQRESLQRKMVEPEVSRERASTLSERSASEIVHRDFDQNLSLTSASKYTLARDLIAKGYSTAEVAQKSGLSQSELSLLGKLPRGHARQEKNF